MIVIVAVVVSITSYFNRLSEEKARQQALERKERALNEPVGPSPSVEDERVRRMLALGEIRRLTAGDLDTPAYTERLAKELGWDGATLDRILNFQARKGLLTVDPGRYELGQRVRLTVAGL